MTGCNRPSDGEFADLLAFRDELRRFIRWSADQARNIGVTPAQHQLLLAVRGHRGAPTIGDVAQHLLVRHHSASGLIDRAERLDLVRRRVDDDDGRIVRITLTPTGVELLNRLTTAHLDDLRRLRRVMQRLINDGSA